MTMLRIQRAVLVGIVLLVFISLFSLSDRGASLLGPAWRPAPIASSGGGTSSTQEGLSSLLLPSEYEIELLEQSNPTFAAEFGSSFCKDRYSTKFILDFRDRRAQYCSDDSTSGLTCFHTVNSGSFMGGSIDSFCIAQHGIVFDADNQKFELGCRARHLDQTDIRAGAIPLAKLNSYQYLTGPKFLLNEYVDLTRPRDGLPGKTGGKTKNFVILLKREVDGNLWHCLNELMAIMTTLDVLRTTPDLSKEDGHPMFSPDDVANTQIVLLDKHPDGAFFDLFQMFSGKPPMRLSEWISKTSTKDAGPSSTTIPVDNLILPFAGAANPLWTDWVRIPPECKRNTMLQVFVHRIFTFYNLPRTRAPSPPQPSADATTPRLNVTIIQRKGSRQLMGLDTHLLSAMNKRFSSVADIRLVDFAAVPFREQIVLARDTDVLVGMHGAGLTHAMFMEEGRGALVEVQPDRLCHVGFRNLARVTRQAYFIAGANKVVGHCYPPLGGGSAETKGELEMMPDDGTALPSSWETSRCWTFAERPDDWAFACSDPAVTGGEQSHMVCRNREESDSWYDTCTKKEASDMYWLTRYVMEEDRFLDLVGRAIDAVREKRAQEHLQTGT